MKKWRSRIIVLFLLMIGLLFLVEIIKIQMTPIDNVFDEMYYSMLPPNKLAYRFVPYEGNFQSVRKVTHSAIWDYGTSAGYRHMYYRDVPYKNESINIDIYDEESTALINGKKMMLFTLSHEYCNEDGEHISYDRYLYTYFIDEKLLVYESTDPENIERKQFLFNIILQDYFDALGEQSDYSMNNLGDFTFIDATLEGNEEYQRNFKTDKDYAEE